METKNRSLICSGKHFVLQTSGPHSSTEVTLFLEQTCRYAKQFAVFSDLAKSSCYVIIVGFYAIASFHRCSRSRWRRRQYDLKMPRVIYQCPILSTKWSEDRMNWFILDFQTGKYLAWPYFFFCWKCYFSTNGEANIYTPRRPIELKAK